MTYDYEYDLKLGDEFENYKICDGFIVVLLVRI